MFDCFVKRITESPKETIRDFLALASLFLVAYVWLVISAA